MAFPLGNTLTTESSEKGTQALGTVHKKVEDKVALADKKYVLDVLNYDMADIFAHIGIDTAGGAFCFPERKDIDPTSKINILAQLATGFNLPVSDDYLYEEFGIEKPANYEQMKTAQEEERTRKENAAAQIRKQEDGEEDEDTEPTPKQKKSFRSWLAGFFAKAPSCGGADLDW